jgi:ferredoxin-NADP reductase
MERQSKALAAEVSLYQTLNAEERAIYKAENDQKIAKYNSEVKQIADAQQNAIASRANELTATFNTARLQAMSATKQRQTLLQKNLQFMAEQEAEVNKRIIELSTDMQNLGSLKSIAEANKSTVEDELRIQAESLRAVVALELAKLAAFNEQLQGGDDDFVGLEVVTGSS